MNISSIFIAALFMSGGSAPEGPMLAAGEYYISVKDVERLKKASLRGSSASAIRLSDYYSVYADDRDAGEFWLKAAAEIGDCSAIDRVLDRYTTALRANEKQISYWEKQKKIAKCTR